VLHAVWLTVPLAKAHGVPLLAAGEVMKNVCKLKPPLQLALQGLGSLQLPAQATGQACAAMANTVRHATLTSSACGTVVK
jgi:hypothetical protein